MIGLHHLDTYSVIESWSGYFHPTDPSGTHPLPRGSQLDDLLASAHSFVPSLRAAFAQQPTRGRVARAPGAGYSRQIREATSDSYAAEEYGREEAIDDGEAANLAKYFDCELDAAESAAGAPLYLASSFIGRRKMTSIPGMVRTQTARKKCR